MHGIPWREIFEHFGYILPQWAFIGLNVLTWLIPALITFGVWKWFKKHREYHNRSYLSRIVIGSGTYVDEVNERGEVGDTLKMRTFNEVPVSNVIGDGVLTDLMVSAAHATTHHSKTQILAFKHESDRNILRSRLTTALNFYSKPEIAGELARASGPQEFIVAMTCEDSGHQRKIRLVITTEAELRKHLKVSLHDKLRYEYGQNYHFHRANLLHELAVKWFDPKSDENQNNFAWRVTLNCRYTPRVYQKKAVTAAQLVKQG